jgi:hypothetical protein
MGVIDGVSQFVGFSARAKLAIDADFSARSRLTVTVPGWSDREFADQLTRWLVEEGLMPVHVTPDDFRCFVSRRMAGVKILEVGPS